MHSKRIITGSLTGSLRYSGHSTVQVDQIGHYERDPSKGCNRYAAYAPNRLLTIVLFIHVVPKLN